MSDREPVHVAGGSWKGGPIGYVDNDGVVHPKPTPSHTLTLVHDDRTGDPRGWPWAVIYWRWSCSCGKDGTFKSNKGDAKRGHTLHLHRHREA